MRRALISLILTLSVSGEIQTVTGTPPVVQLWPNGMPEPTVAAEPEEAVETRADGIQRRTNVSKPRLFVYEPPHPLRREVAPLRAAVIVVPGGGFGLLADEHEGSEAAEWLARHGIVSFLLAHRVPTNQHPAPNAGPVQDLQKAIVEVRRHAAEFHVDPNKIGVLGFSAGGQVALVAATNELKFNDETIHESHKPNFLLLLYPYQIYDPTTKSLRSEIQMNGELPPTFIAQMGDDRGSLPQGSALLYLELINRTIPAEIHVYENGGHGFGMRSRSGASGPTDWQQRALDWLKLRSAISESSRDKP